MINDQLYTHSVLVSPHQPVLAWEPEDVSQLSATALAYLVAQKPCLVLLGTGPQHQHLEASLLAPLYQQGIAVEVMSSAAACRTFTVLSTDKRSVLAAVLIQ